MGTASLAARLILAGVFIAAGVGKLLDLSGSRRALLSFGVPEPLARLGAVALPIAELATAAALLVQPVARWGGAAAFMLLSAFAVGIVTALARGRAPDCHCFGRIHSASASRRQVVRDVALAAVAVFVVIAGPGASTETLVARGGPSAEIEVALGAVTLSLLVVSLDLWLQRRHLRGELSVARQIANAVPPGLAVGALAPGFAVRGANGDTLTLDDLRSPGRPVALLFGAPGCGPCSVLVPELPRWQEALAGTLTIGSVGIDTYLRYEHAQARNGASLQEIHDNDPELAAETAEVNEVLASYRVRATPSAVLVTPEGTIASATVDGKPAIEALIRLAVTRRGAPGSQLAHAHAASPPRPVAT